MSKVIKSMEYDTSFGVFVIQTTLGKRRTRGYSGRTEWKEVRSTTGWFKDYPNAIKFFPYNDYGDRYISSSQGDSSWDWVDSLGVRSYDKAVSLVDSEVVDCFNDYYGEKIFR